MYDTNVKCIAEADIIEEAHARGLSEPLADPD